MKVAIAVLCLVAVAFAGSAFDDWATQHNKVYASSAERAKAYKAFQVNSVRIAAQNAKAKREGMNTVFAHNKFSDLSAAEFKAKFLSGYRHVDYSTVEGAQAVQIQAGDVPQAWSWVEQGKTTPVKDQEQCGSCWAFSATEGIESAILMANQTQQILAPQQIVDCDTVDQGCNGGDLPTAFAYVKKSGQEPETDYPYTAEDGTCKYKADKVTAHISGFQYAVNDGRKNDTILAVASYANGPLSICVDASSWQNYQSGILKRNCGVNIDHCVQLVGWNVQDTTEYWIVRNSWNTDWGVKGFIWIEKNSGKDLCGITTEATWVTL